MEYLAFVNGRNKDELVKIFEGEMYEIDRLTINCIDSNEIRKKYKKLFEQFQAQYPNAKNGAVRIYGDHVYGENGRRVLYKKHKVAFNHIIKDTRFLRWFSRRELDKKPKDRIIYDIYILRGIAEFNKELVRINQFLTTIKKEDRKDTNLIGGARRYYRFMRSLLNYYEEYRQIYNNPSIDDIWKEHLKVLEHHKLEKQPIGDEVLINETELETFEVVAPSNDAEEEVDIEPDHLYLEEQAEFEEPLYVFFTGDYFERYYSQIFADEHLMVVGNLSVSKDANKLTPWIDVSETCYNGGIFAGCIESFGHNDVQVFNSASTVIIYGEEDTRYLRTAIVNAIHNSSEVVFITEDKTLLELYSKKFKNIVTILDSEEDNHLSAKKQLISYFIDKYNLARGYQK